MCTFSTLWFVPTTYHHHHHCLLIYHRNFVASLLVIRFVFCDWFESPDDVIWNSYRTRRTNPIQMWFKWNLFVLEVNKHRTLCQLLRLAAKAVKRYKRKDPQLQYECWMLCVGMWCSELKSTNCHTLCLSNCQKLHTATNENIFFSPEFAICVFLLLCFSFLQT